MNSIAYYWFTFTVLTGFWEYTYLTNYEYISNELAAELVKNHTHVWFNKYDKSYVLPWKFSKIFYAEYGAWADREYMSDKDSWSHQIEGSHMTYCGIFCLWTLLVATFSGVNTMHFSYANAFAMGAQYMNSLLYIGEYSLQVKDHDNVNYNSDSFPLGKFWSKRPFMYINILWMLFPAIITIQHLLFYPDTESTRSKNSAKSKNSTYYYNNLPPYSETHTENGYGLDDAEFLIADSKF
jgi:hypothetical protein